MNRTRTVAAVACLTLLNAPLVAFSQTIEPDPVRMARRTTLLMSRSNIVPEARTTTSVVGSVWSQNDGVPDLVVRLRDLVLGEVWELTRTNDGGDFAFEQVPQGTYLLEVSEEENGDPLALGDIFTIGPNETVAVFVNLPAPMGWASTLAAMLGAGGAAQVNADESERRGLGGTFASAMAALVGTAAGAGVTGLGGGRAASNDDQSR